MAKRKVIVLKRWSLIQNDDGWYWVIEVSNGNRIAYSSYYNRKVSCIKSAKRIAEDAGYKLVIKE